MKKSLIVAIAAVLLGGCASVASPVVGSVTVTKWDGGVSNSEVAQTKTGRACAIVVFGFGGGDASISKAMEDGSITKVANVDHSSINALGLFGKYCTIVTGE